MRVQVDVARAVTFGDVVVVVDDYRAGANEEQKANANERVNEPRFILFKYVLSTLRARSRQFLKQWRAFRNFRRAVFLVTCRFYVVYFSPPLSHTYTPNTLKKRRAKVFGLHKFCRSNYNCEFN